MTVRGGNNVQQTLQCPSQKDNKDECTLDLLGSEKDFWYGTEAGRLKDYRFPDTCVAGDGSNHEVTKTMGAGFCTLKGLHWGRRDLCRPEKISRHNSRYWAGLDRGNEGTSSNRAEHTVLLLCLRKTQNTQDLLYLTEFPRLTRMTRQYLTVSVTSTSTSPERLFSSVGFVKSDLWDRLLDTTSIDVMWVKQAPWTQLEREQLEPTTLYRGSSPRWWKLEWITI